MAKNKKEKAAWEKYVISLGFKWDKKNYQYFKPGNFGSKVTVEMIVKRLFHVNKNDKVFYSNLV